jgi:hypothetical protein
MGLADAMRIDRPEPKADLGWWGRLPRAQAPARASSSTPALTSSPPTAHTSCEASPSCRSLQSSSQSKGALGGPPSTMRILWCQSCVDVIRFKRFRMVLYHVQQSYICFARHAELVMLRKTCFRDSHSKFASRLKHIQEPNSFYVRSRHALINSGLRCIGRTVWRWCRRAASPDP